MSMTDDQKNFYGILSSIVHRLNDSGDEYMTSLVLQLNQYVPEDENADPVPVDANFITVLERLDNLLLAHVLEAENRLLNTNNLRHGAEFLLGYAETYLEDGANESDKVH